MAGVAVYRRGFVAGGRTAPVFGWRLSTELGRAAQVLGGGGEKGRVVGSGACAQTKPIELQEAVEVGGAHYELLALIA